MSNFREQMETAFDKPVEVACLSELSLTNYDIGGAVRLLQQGKRVCRAGWNGKGMWLALQVPDANSKMTAPYVYMKTTQGALIPWLCSQADLLAIDWMIAE